MRNFRRVMKAKKALRMAFQGRKKRNPNHFYPES